MYYNSGSYYCACVMIDVHGNCARAARLKWGAHCDQVVSLEESSLVHDASVPY